MGLKYETVMNDIKNEILSGVLKQGDKIDSETKLMERFGVSRHTAREAVARLTQEGYIETIHGKGSFVNWEKKESDVFKRESRTIAVVSSYINNHIFPAIIQRIEDLASQNGYNIRLNCTYNRVFREKEILLNLLDGDIAGVIVEPAKSALPSPNANIYRILRDKKIPVIFLHGYYDEEHDDYVAVDDKKAGFDAAEYLIKRGHKTIAGVFKSDDIQGHNRYAGMMEALYKYGMEIDEDHIIWMSTQDQQVLMEDALTRKTVFERLERCTATVCYNDDIAITIGNTLMERGITIPDQHSLISFDNTKYGDAFPVPITSMNHPYGMIGEAAFEGLMEKMEKPYELIQKKIHVDVVEKQSVRNFLNK